MVLFLVAMGAAAEQAEERLPWYDRVHAGVSDWLVGTAAGLDSFFGDPRAIEEDYTQTYVRLQMGVSQSRLGDTEWLSRTYAKVPLPKTSRRLNVFIRGGEEDESLAANPDEALQKMEDDSTVGMRYVLDRSPRGHWSITGSIDPSLRLRYRYLQPLGGGWYTRLTPSLYWDEDRDTGLEARGDIERALSPATLFRTTLHADYWDADTGVDWLAGCALLHRINERNAIALDISVEGVSKPAWEVEQYRTGLRFRRNFFRSWLFYEIEPALRWTQEPWDAADELRFDPVLTLRLEIQFGKVRGL